jgi:hypothetical protein
LCFYRFCKSFECKILIMVNHLSFYHFKPIKSFNYPKHTAYTSFALLSLNRFSNVWHFLQDERHCLNNLGATRWMAPQGSKSALLTLFTSICNKQSLLSPKLRYSFQKRTINSIEKRKILKHSSEQIH